MSKRIRKMHPQPPIWWLLDSDDCYFCKNKSNCGGCRILKKVKAQQDRKRRKDWRKDCEI